MRHRSSQVLFEHWCDRRGDRLLPERSEIDPAQLRTVLGDVFILTYNRFAGHPFRLAGTRVCALAGCELKAQSFAALWDESDPSIGSLIEAAADDSAGVVAGAKGFNAQGGTLDLEMLLLPLRHSGQTHLRMIGALAPFAPPYWLGARPLVSLRLTEHRFVGHIAEAASPPLAPALALSLAQHPASPLPRMRHGLAVYDGGQS